VGLESKITKTWMRETFFCIKVDHILSTAGRET
jgi:hypothetical protein